MNIIFKIAKNELRNLFFSPVAWFIAVLFLIQCAYFYMAVLYPNVLAQDDAIKNWPGGWKDWGNTGSLTTLLFYSQDGIITNVFQRLYLFVPLLTMGLLSREINTGTIKLLYSSPVKLRQIVLGKYLAVMVYNMVLLGILAFFMIMAAFQIRSIDYGLLLSALLGFFLMIGTYSAIGLFMSSISTYQIISAIATFTLFFILSRIGSLWQKYDFVRDLTWFLSINGRTEKMLRGLITSKDALYFLIVIVMFLCFTLFRLRGQRESKSWLVNFSRYAVVIITGILLGYATSRPVFTAYWDTTAAKTNTINPKTQKILHETGSEPLEITLYTNLLGTGLAQGLPESRNTYLDGFWEQYRRFKPDIQFKYVYYYYIAKGDSSLYLINPGKTLKQISGIIAGRMELDSSTFMPPEKIQKLMDPDSENARLFMTVKYKGDTVNLRTYNDNVFWPSETEVASKLKRLVEGKVPHIYCLMGDLERSIHKTGEREYSMHTIDKNQRSALVNLGFDVDTLSLEKQEIPSNATALVLADPKTELSTTTRDKLRQYINKGGNMVILGEPGKQLILNPMLLQLGIQLRKGQLVQLDKNETPDKITTYLTDDYLELFNDDGASLQSKRMSKAADTATLQLMMAGATALSYEQNGLFTIKPLLKTFKKGGWLKMGHLVTDSVPPVFSANEGDTKEPSFVTGIQLTRQINNRQQRIVVFGDADFLSNLRKEPSLFYSWLDNKEYPLYLPGPVFKDNLLLITGPTAKILKFICVWVLPGLVLLAAIVLLVRRKRK